MEASHYWQNLDAAMSLWSVLPFASLILLIAILPFIPVVSGWWEKHLNKFKVALVCAASGMLLYFIPTGDVHKIWTTYLEYAAFLAMLASLFVISGGIHISGAFSGFPYTNTIFLAIGAVLANLLGTTGASMIMIRPLLRANRQRQHKAHIVIFFIFIVSNCGGLLTPLGDPPLYLGFLRGVPFDWTLRLAPQWTLIIFLLLFIFYIFDAWYFRREADHMHATLSGEIKQAKRKIHIQGWVNVLFLLGVVGVILAAGYCIHPILVRCRGEMAAEIASKIFQIIMMGAMAFGSYRLTSARIRHENEFTFAPIWEVAVLFFGIFGAMIPALALLEAKSRMMALREPWQYFWMSGGLSGVLDNAPTYLVYATLAASYNHLSAVHLGALADQYPELLAAISCGTVFMGAMTYIGNGPNFMVKSVAEHARVKMPSFGGYFLWSFAILIPVFILQTFIFFR
ncbi:MAG: sodium:proton antiporter [Kiritimatiellae bacterium]|nr:sodium:proton antiporter [Kiritimatiellia bacterium]